MKANMSAFAAGGVFGIGLAISGMTRPEKVVGFLDLGGAWDASLAFVMVGAIAVHFVALRLVRRRSAPLFDTRFHPPARTAVDRRLVLGAAVFGIGWGLGGFCPGPALTSAGAGHTPAIVFAVGMAIGMALEYATSRLASRALTRSG